jgi:2-keto-4-pentenoate hydratase/2-oxohepta-3-ene-1,7-dioic acid hydratase in catechol pathway
MVRCLLALENRFHGVIPPSRREVKTACAQDPDRPAALTGSLPIERPGKIICVGLNYRDHAEEQKLELPPRPLLFAKWPSAAVGPGEPIVLPSLSQEVDYEAELGVVIGARARAIDSDGALDVVAGYVCVNDVTARDLQFADGQWTRAKSLDTFCPVGPELVPAAEIPDPHGLAIRCLVNGEVLQDSSTAHMVFGVGEIVAFASEAITLEPGDLIATGTPAGVGYTRTPPRFLAPGDTVTVEIEGVGALTNPVRAERS